MGAWVVIRRSLLPLLLLPLLLVVAVAVPAAVMPTNRTSSTV
jgi:hypothetical protein